MNKDIISFIEVSYEDLNSEPLKQLEDKIKKNLNPYFEKISKMTIDEKIKLREEVKQTRKEKFRFSQEKTQAIPKERIQLALSQLARLFRAVDDEINQ